MLKLRVDKNGIFIKLGIWKFITEMSLYHRFNVAWTAGIRNTCTDGKKVVFLDYDFVLLDNLIPELRYLMKKYGLSHLWILKSSQKPHSYHVMGVDKLSNMEWVRLLRESSCDESYKTSAALMSHKDWCLRIISKEKSHAPKFFMKLINGKQSRDKSKCHALFLKLHHGQDIKDLKKLDKSLELPIVKYETGSFIK